MVKKYPMTPMGKKKLEGKLAYLKEEKQNEISSEIKHLRSFCHSSEDVSFNEMIEQQFLLQEQTKLIEDMLYNSELIDSKEGTSSTVMIGSTVTFVEIPNDNQETYTIVGTTDANPKENHISLESPIGKSLLGSKINDKIVVELPSENIKVEIIDVRYE